MILQIEIPEEFEDDFNTSRFKDFFVQCNGVMEYFNDNLFGNYEIDTSNMLMDAFENATTWTPVTERLPENGKEYLVTLNYGALAILRYFDGWNCTKYPNGKLSRKFEIKDVVIAWQPLPKPYKGEKNETD